MMGMRMAMVILMVMVVSPVPSAVLDDVDVAIILCYWCVNVDEEIAYTHTNARIFTLEKLSELKKLITYTFLHEKLRCVIQFRLFEN